MAPEENQVDLSVNYAGLKIPNPFVLASAPPTMRGDMIEKAFSLGWGGAVIKTMKPDHMDIEDVSPRFATWKTGHGEVVGFENIELVSKRPLAIWVKEIKQIKQKFPDRLLIASIMAEVKKEDWQELAVVVEKAGVDALELNFSCPHGMPEMGIGAAIGQVPELTKTITAWVKEVVKIPVIVKLTPNVTDVTIIAKAALAGGADGLAAINTVQSLMGVDKDTFVPYPSVGSFSTYGGYSGPAVKPIGLRVVSQLARNLSLPIAGMGGISTWEHALEYLLLGAGFTQICTAVMLKGYGIISELIAGLEDYMMKKGFKSVAELTGISLKYLTDHAKLTKGKTMAVDLKEDWCMACGTCVTVCQDAGYQALSMNPDKLLVIDREKCDGCSLCTHVCRRKALSLKPYQQKRSGLVTGLPLPI